MICWRDVSVKSNKKILTLRVSWKNLSRRAARNWTVKVRRASYRQLHNELDSLLLFVSSSSYFLKFLNFWIFSLSLCVFDSKKFKKIQIFRNFEFEFSRNLKVYDCDRILYAVVSFVELWEREREREREREKKLVKSENNGSFTKNFLAHRSRNIIMNFFWTKYDDSDRIESEIQGFILPLLITVL